MEVDSLFENLWLRKCKNCGHAWYLRQEQAKKSFLRLRKLFGIKEKFNDSCKTCGSKNVVTVRMVKRVKRKPD